MKNSEHREFDDIKSEIERMAPFFDISVETASTTQNQLSDSYFAEGLRLWYVTLAYDVFYDFKRQQTDLFRDSKFLCTFISTPSDVARHILSEVKHKSGASLAAQSRFTKMNTIERTALAEYIDILRNKLELTPAQQEAFRTHLIKQYPVLKESIRHYEKTFNGNIPPLEEEPLPSTAVERAVKQRIQQEYNSLTAAQANGYFGNHRMFVQGSLTAHVDAFYDMAKKALITIPARLELAQRTFETLNITGSEADEWREKLEHAKSCIEVVRQELDNFGTTEIIPEWQRSLRAAINAWKRLQGIWNDIHCINLYIAESIGA